MAAQVVAHRNRRLPQLIDYFALALIHGLLALMVLRLSTRPHLDREESDADGERRDA